jgi:hypothetical protein
LRQVCQLIAGTAFTAWLTAPGATARDVMRHATDTLGFGPYVRYGVLIKEYRNAMMAGVCDHLYTFDELYDEQIALISLGQPQPAPNSPCSRSSRCPWCSSRNSWRPWSRTSLSDQYRATGDLVWQSHVGR